MPRRFIAVILWLALVAWAGAILCLSSLTPDQLPSSAEHPRDKIHHFIAFAAGGWLAASALRSSLPALRPGAAVVVAIALIGTFGSIDESLQLFTPGRSGADVHDWIADLLGATAGAWGSGLTHAVLEHLLPRR